MTLKTKITKEEVKHELFNVIEVEGLWLVSIIYRDALGCINKKYAYFEERWDAENWFSDIKDRCIKDRGFYAYVCDKTYWNNIDNLCKGE